MIRPGITRQVTEPGPSKPRRLPPLTGNALTVGPALPGPTSCWRGWQLTRNPAATRSRRTNLSLATVLARAHVAAAD
jgi:hypothetical protein